ncbi:anti-sigma factor family protein [Anthocerotibacter panamensis]|uniref:anti-sigma factor family protein n=1 Tax=Anthocerotibacter panamensis TaxID=2857077 RepID=UPI001C4036AA|nr:zf-HC2 domain-containing protein [Anthocerotibacter panamensis]
MLDDKHFERLSAYLDGELSPQECRAVEAWLQSNPEAQQSYCRLRRLSCALDYVPAGPGTEIDPERLFRRAQKHTVALWSSVGGAAAAVVVGMLYLPALMAPMQALGTPTVRISQYLLEDTAPVDPYTVLLSDEMVAPQK